MAENTLPKVSFIIPTLNAAGVLGACLQAIRSQDYPADRIEIIVADGGSTDQTRQLAASFGARVVDNPYRVAESGKRVALASAQGELIVFTDADNELSSRDFVRLAVQAMQAQPQALGLESYYPAAPGMNSFCAYLTETLHISDPVTWMMCVNPVCLGKTAEGVERWTFPAGSLAYPLGANGFVFRKRDLESIGALEHFEDTHAALQLARAGRTEWLRLTGRGVHHHVVGGLADFLKKRRRQTYHFLSLKHKSDLSWTTMKPLMPGWAACLLCGTVAVPAWQALRGLIRTGDPRWLWHPLASLVSVTGVAWGALTFLLAKKGADTEASLQPVQKISPEPPKT
jgi:glycosyltransferase involved in cell wall biosynthesis